MLCPDCSGTWISGDSLHELFIHENNLPIFLERFESLFDLDFDESPGTCPSCVSRKLKAVIIEDAEIDFCPSCKGLFFDKGELEEVFSSEYDIMDSKTMEKQVSGEASFWEILLRFINGSGRTG